MSLNIEINGEQYRNIRGNQTDGRCFSGAVFIGLNGRVAGNNELNDWIRENIITPIRALDRRSVEVIKWVLSYTEMPDTTVPGDQNPLIGNMVQLERDIGILTARINMINESGIIQTDPTKQQNQRDIDDAIQGINTLCGEIIVNTLENKDRNIDILTRCLNRYIQDFFLDPNKRDEYDRLYDRYIAYIQSLNVGPPYAWTEPQYGPGYILSTNRDIQRNITIVLPDSQLRRTVDDNFPPLYIFYNGRNHYEPLVLEVQGPAAQGPVVQRPAVQTPAVQTPVAQGPVGQRPVGPAQLPNKHLLKDLSLNINDVHTTLDLPFVFNEDDKFKNLLLKPINYSCKIIETDEFNVDEDNDEDDDDDESGIFGIGVNKNKKKEKQKPSLMQKITGAFKAGGKKNQIISRNVDYIEVNNKKNNFSTIINDCVEKKKYIPPEDTYNLINKYNKLMICCKEEEEDGEDEDIDAMLIKIKESIKNYKGKISKNSQRTFFLTTTIYKNYTKNGLNEADFIKAKYDELNVTDFMNKCNTLLKRLEPVDTALEVMECKYKIKNPYDVFKFNTNQLSQIYDDLSKIDKNDANNFVKEIESFNLKQIFKRYTEFVNKGDEKNAKIYLKGLESYCK